MAHVFDRPTPFVTNSLYLYPSTKADLTAEIGFKSDTAGRSHIQEALRPQIFGGDRILKPSERYLGGYYVPGAAARMDRYGNMVSGQIEQILSSLGKSENWAGHTSNITARSRARNKKPRDYFVILQKHDGIKLIPGVYQRLSKGISKPVMIFIPPPHYGVRFRFYDVARETATREFQRRFFAALASALRGSR